MILSLATMVSAQDGTPIFAYDFTRAGGQGSVGVAQGYKTYFMQDQEGQMQDTHSISAGLDYIGVGPILAWLHDRGRVRFEAATDAEVVTAFGRVVRDEGLIPALESAHAFAAALREASQLSAADCILVNMSGRGDKDIFTIAAALGDERWYEFLRARVAQYDRRRKDRRAGGTGTGQ